MIEQNDKRCFVLLPAGNPHYARLFDELFARAIVEAGLTPCCFQQNSTAPLPMATLLQEIAQADAVFADLSQNDIDLWFALGCALALNKPLCLVSSRLEFSLSLDIQDLEIIPYPANPFPRDYEDLQRSITQQLRTKLPKTTTAQKISLPPQPVLGGTPAPASPFTPAVGFLSELSEDLTSYEVLALTIIDSSDPIQGISPRSLGLEMQNSASANLTSHAMNSLRRRKFIDKKSVQLHDSGKSYTSDNLFIAPLGEDWLIRNGRRKDPVRSSFSAGSPQFLATHS